VRAAPASGGGSVPRCRRPRQESVVILPSCMGMTPAEGHMAIHIPRGEFIATLGSAVARPLAALTSGALVSVALVTGAVAQKPTVPLNTLKAIEVALQACWVPPPINQARPGMQITVMMSFNRSGELFGQPKITFESIGASNDERLAYRIAVAQMLKRCTPLQFTDALGNAVAGRPFRMRLIDARKLKQAYRNLALSRVGYFAQRIQ